MNSSYPRFPITALMLMFVGATSLYAASEEVGVPVVEVSSSVVEIRVEENVEARVDVESAESQVVTPLQLSEEGQEVGGGGEIVPAATEPVEEEWVVPELSDTVEELEVSETVGEDSEYEYFYVDDAGNEIPYTGEVEMGVEPLQEPERKPFFQFGGNNQPIYWLPVLAVSWFVLMRLSRRRILNKGDADRREEFESCLSHKGRSEAKKQQEETSCEKPYRAF